MTHRLIALYLVGLALTACSPEAEKPPPATCSGRCGQRNPGIVGHVPPPNNTGGEGGGPSGGDDSPVTLHGDVRSLDDITALASSPFRDPVDLLVEGVTGDVSGRWNALDPFSLDGVKRAGVTWTQATPAQGDALRTLQPVDTSSPNASGVVETSLSVVRESELDTAFAVISMPITRDPGSAQAILIVLKSGRPASGVRVLAPGAAAVIYTDNGAFTDTATFTDGSGIAILANVPSVAWPGSGYSVTLSGTVTGRWDLKLVSGGVLLAAIGD
ncbi:MAG TPA: hypothetical protein VF103_09835 [Polyangiaceae bacterium]